MAPEPLRTLSGPDPEAPGSTAAPLAPLPGRLKGSLLLFLELVPLEKGSAEDAGELKGDVTGSCGSRGGKGVRAWMRKRVCHNGVQHQGQAED